MASKPGDPRRSRAWRKLRDQVVDEEPECRLAYPGICTGRSETGDHIETVDVRPDLALVRSNVRGACHACNRERSNKPADYVPGPPVASQTPYVRPRALDIFRPVT